MPEQVINVMVFDEDIDVMRHKKKALLGRIIIGIDPKSYEEQLYNMDVLNK